MMAGIVLLLHVLAATVWTGGHLVVALTVLPRVLTEKNPAELLRFDSAYHRIGMPALVIQCLTGAWLAYEMVPDLGQWFALGDPVSRLISVKLALLALTVALAIDARLRVIPRLPGGNLTSLVWHVVSVTVLSVLFVVVGVSFRTGWFY